MREMGHAGRQWESGGEYMNHNFYLSDEVETCSNEARCCSED